MRQPRVILSVMLCFLATVALATDRVPSPVSPGTATGFSSIASGCPTFSWSGVLGARSYELAIYSATSDALTDDVAATRPVLTQRLPSLADSWTPGLELCLAPGKSYAWTVRATTERGDTAWAEPILFRVAVRPSISDVEEALSLLRRYIGTEGDLTEVSASRPADATVENADSESSAISESKSIQPKETQPRGPALSTQRGKEGLSQSPFEPFDLSRASTGRSVTPPSSYALKTDGATDLGGDVYRDGFSFIHTYGGDAGNTALGIGALSAVTPGSPEDTSGSQNTAIGYAALFLNSSGSRNTSLGFSSLLLSSTGADNTAMGFEALLSNGAASSNTAVGSSALRNATGSRNTAVGSSALSGISTGQQNTAVGAGALSRTSSGTGNIAIGYRAGENVQAGSNNIYIGSSGSSGDSGRIRIGSGQTVASIAGDLALGIESPTNRLHVRDYLEGVAIPSNHVALIENAADSGSPDGLGIRIGEDPSAIFTDNNFITFFGGTATSMGAIQGNGFGGVALAGPGADYAEWFPRLDPNEVIQPGDVVGLFGDHISRRTLGADGVMVVSSGSIVAGSDPGEGKRGNYTLVAFVGQAEVRVDGAVQQGDYLVASGRGDGTAVALPPEKLDVESVSWIIGRALRNKEPQATGTVRALVGVADPGPLVALMADQSKTIEAQQREVMLLRLELAELREQVDMPVVQARQ